MRLGLGGASIDDVREVPFAGESAAHLSSLGVIHDSLIIASAETDSVFQRVIETPFADKSKARQSAPLIAEESLPLPLEKLTLHTHFMRKTPGGASIFVAATPTDRAERRLKMLRDVGLEPKALDCEPLALAAVAAAALPSQVGICVVDLSHSASQSVYLGGSGPEKFIGLSFDAASDELPGELARQLQPIRDGGAALRTVYLTGALAASADLPLWREALGVPVEVMPLPKKLDWQDKPGAPQWPSWAIALGLALGESNPAASPHANLITGQFGAHGDEVNWRNRLTTIGVAVAVLVALWAASVGIEASYKKKQLDTVNESIRALFAANMPGVKNVVDEVAQLKQRSLEMEDRAHILGGLLRKEIGPLRVLKEMSDRIPPDIKVEFREFVAEPDRIRIEGETANFDSIDKIKVKLAEYPWFSSVTVSDAKAGVDQKKVIFRLTILLGQKEAAQ